MTMAYRTIRDGKIIQHSRDRNGRMVEHELESIGLKCDRCGWETRKVKDDQPAPPYCACGGHLDLVVKHG